MNDDSSLSHTRWNFKYHIVFVPKYRRKVIYGKLRVRHSTEGTYQPHSKHDCATCKNGKPCMYGLRSLSQSMHVENVVLLSRKNS